MTGQQAWNYLTGGRDNFEADRRAARQLIAIAPVMSALGPAARAFQCRLVRFLAAEAGIRQRHGPHGGDRRAAMELDEPGAPAGAAGPHGGGEPPGRPRSRGPWPGPRRPVAARSAGRPAW